MTDQEAITELKVALKQVIRAFDPPMDLVNAHKVVDSHWFQKTMDNARVALARVEGRA